MKDSLPDFDSQKFFNLMVESGFEHEDWRANWVFELNPFEVHVIEHDVVYIYKDGTQIESGVNPVRIQLRFDEVDELEIVVTQLKMMIIKESMVA